jgi:phosphohistidine phosphatase
MKTLTLFRHAKSSWTDPSLDDFDRPLAPRGIRAATTMGAYMKTERSVPEFVLCSTARRAKETWDLLSAEWPDAVAVAFDEALYLTTPAGILRRLETVSDSVGRVMVIGHNPGLHQLAVRLTFGGDDDAIARLGSHFPTAALAMIDLDGGAWREVEPTSGRLVRFVVPRDLE